MYTTLSVKMYATEPEPFVLNFINMFLKVLDEDEFMEKIFNDKETMTDEEYNQSCKTLMYVKKFKNRVKQVLG